MTKRGRPVGLLANPDAFADLLDGRSQKWLAEAAGMSPSHLNEMLAGSKGATPELAHRIAAVFGPSKRAGTLFPELAEFRAEVRVFTASGLADAA